MNVDPEFDDIRAEPAIPGDYSPSRRGLNNLAESADHHESGISAKPPTLYNIVD
jgi:hypothetical protein